MNKYIKSLDGIRGLGIVFVALYHYLRMNDSDYTLLGFSWIWIQMFFVQSGFLITQILLKSKELPFKLYLKRFYWRRTLRIFPVYFTYLFILSGLFLLFRFPHDFGEKAIYLFTYTYNFTRLLPDITFKSYFVMHFWSLAVEEQFYLVWPFLVYFLSTAGIKRMLVLLMVAGPIFRYFFANYLIQAGYDSMMTGEVVYAFTLSQFDAFAFGAAIPIFKLDEKLKKINLLTVLTVVSALLIGLVNWWFLRTNNPSYSFWSLGYSVAEIGNYQHVWSYSIINIIFTLVIILLISPSYRGLFNNKILVSIGKIVYGMYIIHFGILYFMLKLNHKYIHSFSISFALAFLIAFALAYISYNFYEKKFLALKDLRFKSAPIV